MFKPAAQRQSLVFGLLLTSLQEDWVDMLYVTQSPVGQVTAAIAVFLSITRRMHINMVYSIVQFSIVLSCLLVQMFSYC